MFSQKKGIERGFAIGGKKKASLGVAIASSLLLVAAVPTAQAQGINFTVFATVPTVLVSPNPPATVRPGDIVLLAANTGTWLTGHSITIDFGVPIVAIPANVNDLIFVIGNIPPDPGFSVSASGSVLTINRLFDFGMPVGTGILIRSSYIDQAVNKGIDLNITGNTGGPGLYATFSATFSNGTNQLAFNPGVVQVMRYTNTAPPAVTPARKTQTISE